MNKDQEHKSHVCRFCKQSFSNGRKLGGHMRGHLALISASKKKSTQEKDQEAINAEKGFDVLDDDGQMVKKSQGFNHEYDVINRKQGVQGNDQDVNNGEKGLVDFDDDDEEMIKKSRQEMDVDQDYGANVYVLRENPKRSWRVSNSSKDYGNLCKECGKGFHSSKGLAAHKRCHSRKESIIKKTVCEKCGKGFDSVKALYGHMRCHSIKRSRPSDESSPLSSSVERDDGGAASTVRRKRSCTRYKSPKPNHVCTGLSSFDDDDDDAEEGAICLMMLSRGVRNLDGVKVVISSHAEFAFSDSGHSRTPENNVEFEVSVDGSMEFWKVKNKSEVGLKKDLIAESGSGQLNLGLVGSTLVKCSSTKKPSSCDQDFGDRDAADSEMSLDMKSKGPKNHNCPICFKEFGSDQSLGHHKRIHTETECKATVHGDLRNIHRLDDLNLEEGINNGDVEFKITWVQSGIEWDPLTMVS